MLDTTTSDNTPETPDPSITNRTRSSGAAGCAVFAVFGIVSIVTLFVVWFSQYFGWIMEQSAIIADTPYGWLDRFKIVGIAVVVIAVATVPAMIWTPLLRYRTIYRAWSVALVGALAFGLARGFPHNDTQFAALAQSAIALVLWLVMRRMGEALPRRTGGYWFALVLVPVAALPWLWRGALGSPLDITLALLQGLSFGLLVSTIVDRLLVAPILATSQGAGWDIVLGGFAAGIVIAILLCGFGFDGNQLLMLLALTPLGFAAFALGYRAEVAGGRGWGAVAVLVGGAAAAALAFVDPAELLLILGSGELPSHAFGMSSMAWVVASVMGIVLWFVRNLQLDRGAVAVRWGSVGAMWALAVALYTLTGSPGLYGDKLFVVMREQADLAQIDGSASRDQRLVATYQMLTEHADRTQADLRSQLDRLGIDYAPYYLVNGIEVNGGQLVRAWLESRTDVDRVLLSPRLRPLPDPLPIERGNASAPSSPAWNITGIGADRVWNELGVTGEGIVVGQSDSGVQGDHPALRDGYRGRDGRNDGNWLDPWNGTAAPTDIGGHGTHTLGSAVGRGGIGVAPGAEWFGCVNLGRNIGNPAHYLDCMQFMLAPYPAGGDALHDGDPARAAHVINNSWGCPEIEGCDPAALAPAVRGLRAAGIFVVASAGNSGPMCNSVSDPLAIYDDSFSVGATSMNRNMTSFSSRGPVTVDGSNLAKPDILAPGEDVLSSLPQGTYGINSGTSMAGPHVAGVVALMWSAQPALVGNIDATERILSETARPYQGLAVTCVDANGAEQPVQVQYGIVDAFAAVEAAQAMGGN